MENISVLKPFHIFLGSGENKMKKLVKWLPLVRAISPAKKLLNILNTSVNHYFASVAL